MKVNFLVVFICLFAATLGTTQVGYPGIPINTNINPITPQPLDARDTLSVLSDTTVLNASRYEGQITYAYDTQQYWMFNGQAWVEFNVNNLASVNQLITEDRLISGSDTYDLRLDSIPAFYLNATEYFITDDSTSVANSLGISTRYEKRNSGLSRINSLGLDYLTLKNTNGVDEIHYLFIDEENLKMYSSKKEAVGSSSYGTTLTVDPDFFDINVNDTIDANAAGFTINRQFIDIDAPDSLLIGIGTEVFNESLSVVLAIDTTSRRLYYKTVSGNSGGSRFTITESSHTKSIGDMIAPSPAGWFVGNSNTTGDSIPLAMVVSTTANTYDIAVDTATLSAFSATTIGDYLFLNTDGTLSTTPDSLNIPVARKMNASNQFALIDWRPASGSSGGGGGSGTDDQTAVEVPITDAGGYYVGTEVETALSEVADTLVVFRSAIDGLAASSVSDGDKGDITVSGAGSIWTIDNNIITTAKILDANVTSDKLATTGVTAGTYSLATVTVNNQGQVTNIAQDTVVVSSEVSIVDTYENIRDSTGNVLGYFVRNSRNRGLFMRTDELLTDNGMTIIVDGAGTAYQRTGLGADILMKWAENSADWNSVITAFGLATEVGAKRVIFENTTYIADIGITNSTGFELIGNNTTIKLIDQSRDTVITGSGGQNQITINDGSRFKVGQTVSIITSNTLSGLRAYADASFGARIISIVSNTLTLEKNLNASEVGNSVIENNSLFYIQNPGGLKLKNITIDGNRQNRTGNYGWYLGAIIETNRHIIADSITFRNIVHTVNIGPSAEFYNCSFDSLATAMHLSTQDISDPSLRKKTIFRDCDFRYSGLNYTECEHCEGLITYSNAGYNVLVENCKVFYPRSAIVSPFSSDDDKLVIKNSFFLGDEDSFSSAILFQQNTGAATNTDDKADITIDGCVFDRVGNINVAGNTSVDRRGYYRFKFRNNVVRNGILRFQAVANADVSNNLIYYDSLFDYNFHKISGLGNDTDNAAVVWGPNCEDIHFNNNKIYSLNGDTSLFLGVSIQRGKRWIMKGGEILGFKIGLSAYDNANEGQTARSVELDGVLIEVTGKAAPVEEPVAVGARISRGNTVRNCTIRSTKGAGFLVYPLQTIMSNYNVSDSVGVFVVNNRLETTALVGTVAGLANNNNSVWMGNYGFSSGGSATAPGQTGFGSDIIHDSGTAQYSNSIFINNYIWKNTIFEPMTLTLPIYLNLVRGDD